MNVFRKMAIMFVLCSAVFNQSLLLAQESVLKSKVLSDTLQVTQQIDVKPSVSDAQISKRLQNILRSTEWFNEPKVSVQEGVVFLEGSTSSNEYRLWAGELSRNTQNVVAVVNRIKTIERSAWDLDPAMKELRKLFREMVSILPLFIITVVVLILTWLAAKFTAWGARKILHRRIATPLLLDIAAKALSIPIFLIGLYFILQISGLTRLALTVIGATGLVGLIIGFAFRDIMENFLASILISLRRPFLIDDTIQLGEHVGIVQKVTTRGTVIMAYDGNHIQIPNSTVYKNIIVNYTANPNRRMDFEVGIGYENPIPAAQEIATSVLAKHPAVLKEPEPVALVEKLGAATVILRIYFWFDGLKYDGFKIRSSLIRLVKRAFEDSGFSMPDEAREIIFPEGVPIQMLEKPSQEGRRDEIPHEEKGVPEEDPLSTASEGGFMSNDKQIQQQARRSRSPEEGEDLI